MLFEHIRLRKKFQKNTLAHALHLSTSTLNDMIRNERIPQGLVIDWAQFLEITPHPLYGYKQVLQYNSREQIYRQLPESPARDLATDLIYFGNDLDLDPVRSIILSQTLTLIENPLYEVGHAISAIRGQLSSST